jgi:hypothetical protein
LDADLIQRVADLLTTVEGINGVVPTIAKVCRPTGGVGLQIQETEFRNEYMELYHTC